MKKNAKNKDKPHRFFGCVHFIHSTQNDKTIDICSVSVAIELKHTSFTIIGNNRHA